MSNNEITKTIERPDASFSDGSEQLALLLDETLAKYPQHYEASLQLLDTVTKSNTRGWRCQGAMETKLTIEGMEVTFDYVRMSGEWRRFLLIVTMYEGKVTNRQYRELLWGERSGVQSLDDH